MHRIEYNPPPATLPSSSERYMGVAGYRDTSGNWLARPSQPFGRYDEARLCSEEEEEEQEAGTLGGANSKRWSVSGGSGGGSSPGPGASVLFVRESKLIQVRLC